MSYSLEVYSFYNDEIKEKYPVNSVLIRYLLSSCIKDDIFILRPYKSKSKNKGIITYF